MPTSSTQMAWVYILKCADGSYYTGSHRGEDVGVRVAEHQAGKGGDYTRRRLPVELVWSDWSMRVADAVAFERRIKGWSKAKKEALIAGDFDGLSLKARRRGGVLHPILRGPTSRAPQDDGGWAGPKNALHTAVSNTLFPHAEVLAEQASKHRSYPSS